MKWAVGAFILFFVTGCVNMAPDYQSPDLGIETPQSYQQAATDLEPIPSNDRWWEAFGDTELNRLVEEVLHNNWDIKQAAARILETRYRFIQVRSDRYPDYRFQSRIRF